MPIIFQFKNGFQTESEWNKKLQSNSNSFNLIWIGCQVTWVQYSPSEPRKQPSQVYFWLYHNFGHTYMEFKSRTIWAPYKYVWVPCSVVGFNTFPFSHLTSFVEVTVWVGEVVNTFTKNDGQTYFHMCNTESVTLFIPWQQVVRAVIPPLEWCKDSC